MSYIDFFDLNSMIIGLIAISILILIIYKKIEFRIYVPGLICVIMVFIAELFENIKYNVFYEFLENGGILLGSILLFLAALIEYYKSNPKRNEKK